MVSNRGIFMKFFMVFLLMVSFAANAQGTCVPNGKLLFPTSETITLIDQVMVEFKDSTGLLLGEIHNRPVDHKWQLAMLKQVYAFKGDKTSLVIEMLPTSVQGVLDAWMLGAIDTDKMLVDTGWEIYWRHDFAMYKPIFDFAKENQIRIIAGNTTKVFRDKVRTLGWSSLSVEDYRYVPVPTPPTRAYAASLMEVSSAHGHATFEEFVKFVSNQQLWDTIMAKYVANEINKGYFPVLLVGAGHVQYGWGVPFQLENTFNTSGVKGLLVWHNGSYPCQALTMETADAVFGAE